MGKKKGRNNAKKISKPMKKDEPVMVAPINEASNDETKIEEKPRVSSRTHSIRSLNLSYDEMDLQLTGIDTYEAVENVSQEVEIIAEDETQDDLNISSLPAESYKVVYLSGDSSGSPNTRTRSNISVNKIAEAPIAAPRNRKTSINDETIHDGDAYAQYHNSRNNLYSETVDFSNHDFADDKCLSGFPRSICSSKSSINNGYGNEFSNCHRDSNTDPINKRSRSQSSCELTPKENKDQDPFSNNKGYAISRSISQTSYNNHDNYMVRTSEGVRTYHADSECLQQRLSKLSIHTNNDEFVLIGGRPEHFESLQKSSKTSLNDIENTSFGIRKHEKDDSEVGKSISQRNLVGELSRASSKISVGSASTDYRLRLAAKYCQLPEAEGLTSNHSNQSSNVNTAPLSSENQLTTDKVNFSDFPTLYSHPDDRFDEEDNKGEPYLPTKEHKKTPKISLSRSSLRSSNDNGISTDDNSATTIKCFGSESNDNLIGTPQTVIRRNEPRRLITKPIEKKTCEIAIQTGDTIRLRQGSLNSEVLSALATIDNIDKEPYELKCQEYSSSNYLKKRPNRPLQNNSFERNGHPAASVIASLLQKRANDNNNNNNTLNREPTKKDCALKDKLGSISKLYSCEGEDKMEVAQPSLSSNVVTTSPVRNDFLGKSKNVEDYVDAKWPQEKPQYGDSIRKHIPRGRIRDLANVFEAITCSNPALNTKSDSRTVSESKSSNDRINMRNNSEQNDEVLSNIDAQSSSSSNRQLYNLSLSSNTEKPRNPSRLSSTSTNSKQSSVFNRNTFLRKSINEGSLNTSSRNEPASFGGEFVSMFERIPSIREHDRIDNTDEYRQMGVNQSEIGSGDHSNNYSQRNNEYRRSYSVNERTRIPIIRRETTISEHRTINSQKDYVPKSSSSHNFKESNAPKTPINIPIKRISNDSINTTNSFNVPIKRMASTSSPKWKKKFSPMRMERSKTQEVKSNFLPQQKYDVRANSGDMKDNAKDISFFESSRDAFGRQTTEDLTRESILDDPTNWKTRNVIKTRRDEGRNMFEERKKLREQEERMEQECDAQQNQNKEMDTHNSCSNESPYRENNLTNTRIHSRYSPPVTEDAGSRITHHTFQEDAQSYGRSLTTAEESSIPGKIDKMFAFVENDELTRRPLKCSSTGSSGISLNGVEKESVHYKKKYETSPNKFAGYVSVVNKRIDDQRGEWERVIYERKSNNECMSEMDNENSPSESYCYSPIFKFVPDDAYSLTQYREIQRERLQQRPSNEPQYFRSPSLTTPHAGQTVNSFRPSRNPSVQNSPGVQASSKFESYEESEFQRSLMEENNNLYKKYNEHETWASTKSGVSCFEKVDEISRKIERVSYMIENTQKIMHMNEAALAEAVKRGRQSQEIAANRLILISRESLKLQRYELRKLHAMLSARRPPPPLARELRGSVSFSNVVLSLNKNFCNRLAVSDNHPYAFLILFKCGHQVESTEYLTLMVNSSEQMRDKLFFEKVVKFTDVPIDFSVAVEVYAMQLQPQKTSDHSLGSSFAMKCKNLIGPPQRKTHVNDTSFKIRGQLTLDRDAAFERNFYLDHLKYPLEGTISITTECSKLPEAFEEDFRGFLSMYQTISNMASWERYWAVLRRGVIFLWKYPEEEQIGKDPKMKIDLTKCTNNVVDQCSADICPRPNSFSIQTLVDAEECTVGSIVEKRRVILSADSNEMLKQWLFSINQTLDVIRGPI